MSIYVSQRCWNAQINPHDKLMLLALADIADEDGVCNPRHDTSYDKLGRMCGVTRRSAMRAVDRLETGDYIIKFGTVGRGNSNTFLVSFALPIAEIDRLKAEHPILIKAIAHANDNDDNPISIRNGDTSVTNSHRKGDYSVTISDKPTEAKGVTSVTINKGKGDASDAISSVNGDASVTQSIIKSPSKKNPSKDTTSKDVVASSNHQEILEAMAKTCLIDLSTCTEKQRGSLAREAKLLREKLNPTLDDMRQFYWWWWHVFWKGRDKQEPPYPSDVRANWPKFLHWYSPPEPESAPTPGWQTDVEIAPAEPVDPVQALKQELWRQLEQQTQPRQAFLDMWSDTELIAENDHYVLVPPSPQIGERLQRFGIPKLAAIMQRQGCANEIVVR